MILAEVKVLAKQELLSSNESKDKKNRSNKKLSTPRQILADDDTLSAKTENSKPSEKLNKSKHNKSNQEPKMNIALTGFDDAESSKYIKVNKSKTIFIYVILSVGF